MKVSVVMPAKNAAATLPQSIQSILDQDHSDLEFHLVDHQSSDDSREVMNHFAAKDSRIKISKCDGTFIDACNLAWQKSSGDLIARMDADDYAYPNRISTQVNYLKEHQDTVGCAAQVNIVKRSAEGTPAPPDTGYAEYEKWINSLLNFEEMERERFIDSPIPNPTVMLRRSVLEEYGGYRDQRWAEDYDLWLRLFHDGKKLGKIAEKLIHWYDGETRATRTYDRYSLENFQRAKAHFLAKLPLVQERGVTISGAGPTGKRIAKYLFEEKVKVHGFFEVNPRQIGNVAAGKPIFPIDEVKNWEAKSVVISAVGQPGARERIRNWLSDTTFIEGVDFFCVA